MSTIKWYTYNPNNNKVIDEAYWAGESSVRIVSGRKKYTIQFHNMLQVIINAFFIYLVIELINFKG